MNGHNRKISIIGLGYVGLAVAVELGKKQHVIGFDTDKSRIKELSAGIDSNNEIDANDIAKSNVTYTSDAESLNTADFYIITVPTPIDKANQPVLSYVFAASKIVAKQLKPGDIVVFESTVYPGATEECIIPVLENESGLVWGQDFFVGYSPERINPGDKLHTFTTVTKIVSADSPDTLNIVAAVYESAVTGGIYKADSIKVAEAAKVIENTQRDLNVALMNEIAIIFDKMDVDTQEVLAAASTKWNFIPFEPGLVGGHCIGVDPFFLTYKSATLGYHPQVILAGRRINDSMGIFVANKTIKELAKTDKKIKDSVVTILGFTFKENISDIRNTKVTDIVKELKGYGVQIQIIDPIACKEKAHSEYKIDISDSENGLKPADAVILAVPHQHFLRESWCYVSNLLTNKQGIVIDVKSKLDRKKIPEGISLWRL